MKLRAPFSVKSISHGGENINVASDGSVEVSKEAAAVLVGSHGFTHWDAPSLDATTASREQLIEKAIEMTRLQLSEAPTEQIRESVLHFDDERKEDAPEGSIDAMTRAELFAYLRERGVAASPSMPNATLRDIARETEAKEEVREFRAARAEPSAG
jgi:hypothetical protein